MSSDRTISPDQALRQFLATIADEASENAAFRNRLLLALGVPILFEGDEDLESIEPTEMAKRYDVDRFKRIYGRLNAASLKRVLLTSGLATPTDTRGVRAPALLEMLWDRASQQ